MKKHILVCFNFMLVFFILVPSARADWINLTGAQSAPNIAEIYVEDDRVRLVLEVSVVDLDKFVDLWPDNFLKAAGIEPPPVKERMRRFSEEIFQFISEDKKKLQAELKLVEPRMRKERPNPFAGMINPYTRQPVPGPPEDRRVLYAELIYPFERKPGSLTIIPPLGKGGLPEDKGRLLEEIDRGLQRRESEFCPFFVGTQ